MKHYSLGLTIILFSVGCGSEKDADGDYLNTCIESKITLAGGVYGQLFQSCDSAGCEQDFAKRSEIRVYDQNPDPESSGPFIRDLDTKISPIKTSASDDVGFYQLELAIGTFYICTETCRELTLTTQSPLQRWDWGHRWSGPDGQEWMSADECWKVDRQPAG